MTCPESMQHTPAAAANSATSSGDMPGGWSGPRSAAAGDDTTGGT
eukprot:CAMPEP_0197609796 /NCGR_PEP_ID=MMETSP1326-20131121/51894_1 /TAXON_ID=1155430 /ORGANISM="Genus nov. species nov., Strain RCC2288" /LENGTH=44 /DNA_ID= /DNA_START= /DNA_END= /DNA_ORIENTATION=